MAVKFRELSKGQVNHRYVPEPEDPMEHIFDALLPEVGPGVTKEEVKEMPPPVLRLYGRAASCN